MVKVWPCIALALCKASSWCEDGDESCENERTSLLQMHRTASVAQEKLDCFHTSEPCGFHNETETTPEVTISATTTPPFGEQNETKPCELDRFGFCDDPDDDLDNATDVGVCMLVGDPHITTFDSEKRNTHFYDYGDYWIVKSRLVGVQGRYWSTRTDGQSSVRELAIVDPGSDNVIIVRPFELAEEKGTSSVTYNGLPLEENVESEWMTYMQLSEDEDANGKVSSKRAAKKVAKKNGVAHLFAIHTTDHEKGEVLVEVHQFHKSLNVIVTMWNVGKISGHCGNFDGDVTNEKEQSEWLQMIDPSLVAFEETIDWVALGSPSFQECSAKVKAAAVGACQSGLSSDADEQDMEDCIVDWCNDPDAGQKMIEAEFFTNNAKKKAKKEAAKLKRDLRKLKCLNNWEQLGDLSSDNSMTLPYSTQEVRSASKCGSLCRASTECKAYSYSVNKVCSFHAAISTTQSADNQLLCERTLKKVASRPKTKKANRRGKSRKSK